ncbi:MAG: tetratricopeptide repeat protein [Acidobacteriaceae bacterium]
MPSIKALKHDRTQEVANEAVHWTQSHRNAIIATAAGALIVAAIIIGVYTYMQNQDRAASTALGHAMQVLQSPVRQPGQPADPNQPSFANAQERDKAALGEFEGVAGKFPRTDAGHYSLFMAGVVQLDSGDIAAAEKSFTRTRNDGSSDVSSLAKLALANIYVGQKRDADAIKIYKDLMDHPTNSVPKVTPELELAQYYESHNQKADAVKLYDQMQKENAKSPIGQLAQSKITELEAGK